MSSFFDSEIVLASLTGIHTIQKILQKKFFMIPSLSHEERVEFILLLETLVEKQEIMYFRMKLSDDEESKKMISEIKKSAIILGVSPETSLEELFDQMKKTVLNLRKSLDMESET